VRADVLIVGQGLAGTLLGWALERAGVSFSIADPGHAGAAALAGAGLINPITGRRLVKSWRIDAGLPLARHAYQEIESALGVRLWHELRVRRLFADDRERAAFAAKRATGELAPFAGAADDDGFWIEGAARVDVRALLAATRAHWQHCGRLRPEALEPAAALDAHALVIDCRGLAAAGRGGDDDAFAFVPWEFAKGELLELAVAGLAPGVVLNRRHWLLPVDAHTAWVGATHEPGITDPAPTAAARARLAAAVRGLLGEHHPFAVVAARAGVRVTSRDKHPVAGRSPREPRRGIVNALGAKGALLAPVLAEQWAAQLVRGAAFDREIDVARFET
jgi:glycine/D-amino acid oxidase-like deaminating enzyme